MKKQTYTTKIVQFGIHQIKSAYTQKSGSIDAVTDSETAVPSGKRRRSEAEASHARGHTTS